MSKVIVLSDSELEKVLDEKSVIEAVEGAYRQKCSGEADVWPMVFYEFDPDMQIWILNPDACKRTESMA